MAVFVHGGFAMSEYDFSRIQKMLESRRPDLGVSITYWVLLLSTAFRLCAAAPCDAKQPTMPPVKVVSVKLIPQETAMWCWAASGQMVMSVLGKKVSQCVQANNEFGRSDCPCDTCDGGAHPPAPDDCVNGGWPEFDKYGFKFNQTDDKALEWNQLKDEIDAGRPVAFSWHWAGGGGHMMVAYGYGETAGQRLVYYLDPWEPCRGASQTMTYEYYDSQAGDHTHWNDFYGVSK